MGQVRIVFMRTGWGGSFLACVLDGAIHAAKRYALPRYFWEGVAV